MHNVLHAGLCWPTLHKDAKAYCRDCDACQRTGRPSWRDELPLIPHMTLQPFEKWVIDFLGPIQPPGKKTGVRYIIMMRRYLTRWVEAQCVKEYTNMIAMKYLFECILIKFDCTKILMSGFGKHFLNESSNTLTKEFQVYHQKSTPYHPQANGTMEAFNKILERTLKKVSNS